MRNFQIDESTVGQSLVLCGSRGSPWPHASGQRNAADSGRRRALREEGRQLCTPEMRGRRARRSKGRRLYTPKIQGAMAGRGTWDDSCMPQKSKTPGRGGAKDDCCIPRKSMDEGPRRTMHNNSKTLLRKARNTSRESTSQEGRGATLVYTRNERAKGQDGAMDDN